MVHRGALTLHPFLCGLAWADQASTAGCRQDTETARLSSDLRVHLHARPRELCGPYLVAGRPGISTVKPASGLLAAVYQPLRPWSDRVSPQLVLRTPSQDGKVLVADRTHRSSCASDSSDPLYDRRRGSRNADWLLGGWLHWQAFVYALWEAFMVVGVCIGLLVLLRTRWNRQGRLAKGLAANAYTVYLIHPLVIVSVAYAFQAVALYPLLKFVIAVLIALPLCFLISSFIRKIPLADRIL